MDQKQPTLYDILHLEPTASNQEIFQRAQAAQGWYNQFNSKEERLAYRQVQKAIGVLTNEEKRAQYDLQLFPPKQPLFAPSTKIAIGGSIALLLFGAYVFSPTSCTSTPYSSANFVKLVTKE